jgi:LysR family transcriptional regulator, low CO2-responsive transcriptional regulator
MNESLDSRQLRAFVMLAKTGSYTEAAKQLCLTHSAVSHSMRALEEQVACRLFNRLGKKSELTEAGETLLHHAVRALAEMERASRALTELNRWGSRRLRLAADPIFASSLLAPVLAQLHTEFPNLRIQLLPRGTETPANLLENDRADVVLAAKPAANDLIEFVPVLADRFYLVVRAGHPLTAKKVFLPEEAGQFLHVLLRHAAGEQPSIEEFLQRRGVRFGSAMEFDNVEVIKGFLQQTDAVGLLPGWTVAAEVRQRALAIVPASRKIFEHAWGLTHLRGRPLNQIEASLRKICLQRAGDIGQI